MSQNLNVGKPIFLIDERNGTGGGNWESGNSEAKPRSQRLRWQPFSGDGLGADLQVGSGLERTYRKNRRRKNGRTDGRTGRTGTATDLHWHGLKSSVGHQIVD